MEFSGELEFFLTNQIKTSNMKNFLVLFCFFIVMACNQNSSNLPYDEATTRGNIKVAADDSYRLLMQTQSETFMSIYNYAEIEVIYGAEGDIMPLLLDDSVRFAVISRELDEQEKKALEAQKIFPKTYKIAYDALAFIVNKENPDSNFTYKQLSYLFTSKDTAVKWSAISDNNLELKDKSVQVVFDHPKSGNARSVKEFFKIEQLPSYCYAVNNNQQVIDYVQKNKNAIGVIGVNWISDSADSVSNSFLNSIKVVSVSSENDADGKNGFFKPYQAYLATKEYPFSRPVNLILREPFSGLGTGFGSFISGDKGQRIIRLSGLLPANVPIRLVETRSDN